MPKLGDGTRSSCLKVLRALTVVKTARPTIDQANPPWFVLGLARRGDGLKFSNTSHYIVISFV